MLHSKGVVHRNIKANTVKCLKLDDDQIRVRIVGFTQFADLDYGIKKAKLSKDFSSPELTKNNKCTDPKADIWSLGIYIHYILTGKLP